MKISEFFQKFRSHPQIGLETIDSVTMANTKSLQIKGLVSGHQFQFNFNLVPVKTGYRKNSNFEVRILTPFNLTFVSQQAVISLINILNFSAPSGFEYGWTKEGDILFVGIEVKTDSESVLSDTAKILVQLKFLLKELEGSQQKIQEFILGIGENLPKL